MTSALLDDAGRTDEPQWVQQQARLWVGRVGGLPVGTIERGRRFTYVDTEGVVRARHRRLVDAQAAWCAPDAVVPTRREPRVGSMLRAFLASAAVATACAAVLLGVVLLLRA